MERTEKQSVLPGSLVLASGSPRRRELLAQAGYPFSVVTPELDEPAYLPASKNPVQFAQALAYFKAACVSRKYNDALVLGADTVAEVNGKILGKPKNADHAREMLAELSSKPHRVITGIALINRAQGKRIISSDTTWIEMTPLSPDQIEDYIATGEWEGKAGAYGIQGKADRYVKSITGSWSNVVGLPMELLDRFLRKSFAFQK